MRAAPIHRQALGRRRFWSSLSAALLLRWLRKRAETHVRRGRPRLAVFAFDHIGHEVNINGAFESYELEVLAQWLTGRGLNRGSAVDVGANIGNHALFLSRLYKRVFAFEPDADAFDLLALNARRAGNIRCYRMGLSEAPGKARLLRQALNSGAARISLDAPAGAGSAVSVELGTLDGIGDLASEEIGLIKIDVEGHERQALLGAAETIRRNKPIIVFEQHARDFSGGTTPVLELLRSLGYSRFAAARSYPRLPRAIPGLLRTPATVLLRSAVGYGFEIKELERLAPDFYPMLIALPERAP